MCKLDLDFVNGYQDTSCQHVYVQNIFKQTPIFRIDEPLLPTGKSGQFSGIDYNHHLNVGELNY